MGNGTFSMERLDDMAIRIVSTWYKLGQDKGYPSLGINRNVLDPKTNELAREFAAKSIVLLKNKNHTLPLAKNTT